MENQLDGHEVIVEIRSAEHKRSNSSDKSWEIEANDPLRPAPNIEQVVQLDQANQGLRSRKKMFSCTDSSGIEIPLQVDVVQSQYPKPKPRSVESSDVPISAWTLENNEVSTPTSPQIVPPQIASPRVDEHEDGDDDDEGYYKVFAKPKVTEKLRKNIKHLFSIKCILIISITTVLILSKTIDKLENNMEIWIFELWEWCVLLLAILCGRFLSSWCLIAIILLIDNQFPDRKKLRYVLRSLRKSIGVFIWLGLVLLTWELFINRGDRKSRGTGKVVMYITRGIASTFVVSGLWVPRTLLVKIINSSIYVSRYAGRIPEDIFCFYILQTLSWPPLKGGSESINVCKSPGRRLSSLSFTKKKETIIDVLERSNINYRSISVWTIKEIIKAVSESEFQCTTDENAANTIFRNVAKAGHKYITQDDLLRFMDEVEVKNVFAMIGGDSETIRITDKSIINWVKDASYTHRALVYSMNDTKSAIKELNKFVTAITVALYIIIWLIITKIATREVLLFISSQFLLAIFTFGASAKSTVEAIIFLFVKYPFETGDRCLVDGVQVVVKEVNILTTVFLKNDNGKIYYSNSELALKPIINFNRSPAMGDFVDFDLDVSTSNEIISVLKAKIKGYIDSKPQFWHGDHDIRVLEIQEVNKIKMRLCVIHTINFQSYGNRTQRISKLVEELKKFFEELGIKYHYLSPRSIHDSTF